MTTIAIKDGILAADTQATDESSVVYVNKTIRLPNGGVAGGAGDLGEIAQALAYLTAGDPEIPPPDISNSCIVYADETGVYMAATKWPAVRTIGPLAIGSGAQGALVAMRKFGAGAAEAVRAVSGVDPSTGGRVMTLAVKAKRRKR